MQERKNKRLFILLVVLISATIGLFWFGREKESFNVDKNLFRDYNLQTIDKVDLHSPANKISLHYNGSRWKVNDRYDADSRMIDVLFATLQQAEPKRPVATSLQDSLNEVLKNKGVKVSLWSGEKLEESFYAGGNESKTQAYFKKEDNGAVYVMSIPGYRVYVSEIFELNESGWRDKHVFAFNWHNFQSLEAKFQKPANNFEVAMSKDFFGIKGIAAVDTTKLTDFLDNLSLLTVDEYISAPPASAEFASSEPIVTFLVKDIAQMEYTLKLFPSQNRRRFYGLLNEDQWAIFQDSKVTPVLRPKEFFIQR